MARRDTVVNRSWTAVTYLMIGLALTIPGWFFLPTSAYVKGWATVFIIPGMLFLYFAWSEWTDRFEAREQ